eukprot:gene14191-21754_t
MVGIYHDRRPSQLLFDARPHQVVAGRYRVMHECGTGNFARVFKAVDLRTGEAVALKVLKRQYARDARSEAELLKAINAKDPDRRQKLAHMRGFMTVEDHPCFIFDLLGPSLKSRNLANLPVSRRDLAHFIIDIAGALRFLHFECRIVHTDLKPENILLDAHVPSGLGKSWSLCDFGNASTFGPNPDRDLVSTRFYRAPEVIFGMPWSYAVDMWSLGCIVFEIAKGAVLFSGTSDEAHAAELERHVGAIPGWMAGFGGGARARKLGVGEGRRRPAGEGIRPTTLEAMRADDPTIGDMLCRMLQYDAALRIRADELLHHPFVLKIQPAPPPPLLQSLPPSGYTSLAIRTPGAVALSESFRRTPSWGGHTFAAPVCLETPARPLLDRASKVKAVLSDRYDGNVIASQANGNNSAVAKRSTSEPAMLRYRVISTTPLLSRKKPPLRTKEEMKSALTTALDRSRAASGADGALRNASEVAESYLIGLHRKSLPPGSTAYRGRAGGFTTRKAHESARQACTTRGATDCDGCRTEREKRLQRNTAEESLLHPCTGDEDELQNLVAMAEKLLGSQREAVADLKRSVAEVVLPLPAVLLAGLHLLGNAGEAEGEECTVRGDSALVVEHLTRRMACSELKPYLTRA